MGKKIILILIMVITGLSFLAACSGDEGGGSSEN